MEVTVGNTTLTITILWGPQSIFKNQNQLFTSFISNFKASPPPNYNNENIQIKTYHGLSGMFQKHSA